MRIESADVVVNAPDITHHLRRPEDAHESAWDGRRNVFSRGEPPKRCANLFMRNSPTRRDLGAGLVDRHRLDGLIGVIKYGLGGSHAEVIAFSRGAVKRAG